jgi:hypothetical protein
VINFEQTSGAEIGSSLSLRSTRGSPMSIYRFVLRSHGAQVEHLGALPLRNDGEAVEFGRAVVRDMSQGVSPQKAAVMEVIDGERTVGRIGPDSSS